MSYDVYFWHRLVGDRDDALDALAAGDLAPFVPHPAVRAFRQEVVTLAPDADMHYVALTLPFGWTEVLPRVVELASAHGLVGWDPQQEASLPDRGGPARAPRRPAPDVSGQWTVRRLSERGVGTASLSRAWAAAGLGAQATFGEAVGVFILAMAMRDGFDVTDDEARDAVAEVARQCSRGVPTQGQYVRISNSITDVTGFARSLAEGG